MSIEQDDSAAAAASIPLPGLIANPSLPESGPVRSKRDLTERDLSEREGSGRNTVDALSPRATSRPIFAPPNPETLPYWLAFAHVSGIGPRRMALLLDRFGSPEAAWRAPEQHFVGLLDGRSLESLVETRASLDLDRACQDLRKAGARMLLRDEPDYPELLRRAPRAPFLLFVRGDVNHLTTRAVAVVGTRAASSYGIRATRRLAGDMAAAGVTIVSGMAAGIDTIAHKAALEVGGSTVAVLGCGIDRAYPPSNRALMEQIIEEGSVASEYPPGFEPIARHFPARNRIVSGLCLATLVVEAGERSGATITAGFALDQGRDVFAVPGEIFSDASAGTNRLLTMGAGVARSAEDILTALDLTQVAAQNALRRAAPSDPREALLLSKVEERPVHIDELARETGWSVAEVARTLTILEMKGYVVHAGGMRWLSAD